MPRGPKGEKRPADTIKRAVLVMRIATGQLEEEVPKTKRAKSGKVGGQARAKALSPQRRREIAKKAAKARWGKT